MTYKNDFGLLPDDDQVTTSAWEVQPIELPLTAWCGALARVQELEHELSDVRRMWADNNAQVRKLENETARLRGEIDALNDLNYRQAQKINALEADLDAMYEAAADDGEGDE